MRIRKQGIIFFLFGWISMVSTVIHAQDSDFGNWWIYFGNLKINERFNWHHEVQYRNYNFIGDTEQLLLRTGLGYNITANNNNLLMGYGFIQSEPYISGTENKTKTTEHRIYQQFITRQVFGRTSLQHRYRFEQRFIGDDVRMRLRYFLGLNVALTQKTMMDNTLYLSAYNEIFINTKMEYFDRNRFYAGLGYRFNPVLRAELGWLRQSLRTTFRDQANVIVFASF